MGEAGTFSQGMTMVETALKNALTNLNNISFPVTENVTDALSTNTQSSKDMIIESINNLLTTVSNTKTSVIAKAKEIDDRILQEELERQRKLMEEKIDDAIE